MKGPVKKKKAALEALSDCGCNVTIACEAIGIGRRTHYDWLKDDEDYAAKVADLQESTVDKVEGWLYNKIFDSERDSDQIKAAETYLKARAKSRGYGVEKRDNNVSGELKNTAPPIIIKLPDNGRRTYTDEE